MAAQDSRDFTPIYVFMANPDWDVSVVAVGRGGQSFRLGWLDGVERFNDSRRDDVVVRDPAGGDEIAVAASHAAYAYHRSLGR